MKVFIIRLLLIAALYLLFRFALSWPEALLTAYVIEYILEPIIIPKT